MKNNKNIFFTLGTCLKFKKILFKVKIAGPANKQKITNGLIKNVKFRSYKNSYLDRLSWSCPFKIFAKHPIWKMFIKKHKLSNTGKFCAVFLTRLKVYTIENGKKQIHYT